MGRTEARPHRRLLDTDACIALLDMPGLYCFYFICPGRLFLLQTPIAEGSSNAKIFKKMKNSTTQIQEEVMRQTMSAVF